MHISCSALTPAYPKPGLCAPSPIPCPPPAPPPTLPATHPIHPLYTSCLVRNWRRVAVWNDAWFSPWFSAPRGMMTSANFLVGRQNSSKAGFTELIYWLRTLSRVRPRSWISLVTTNSSRHIRRRGVGRRGVGWRSVGWRDIRRRDVGRRGIRQTSASQSRVSVCVDKQHHVILISQLWPVERQNALKQHNVCRWNLLVLSRYPTNEIITLLNIVSITDPITWPGDHVTTWPGDHVTRRSCDQAIIWIPSIGTWSSSYSHILALKSYCSSLYRL